LWRGILPADLALGTHVLHVQAVSPDGEMFSDERSFQIASP
jgi:hypothetical protein